MSLLKIVNEKNLSIAREQNPLTKLPGNTLIYEYISAAIIDRSEICFFIYFDFDHFKSYNDKYGFRHGDRLILRFAELLQVQNNSEKRFVGHIGGDDFFMGVKGMPLEWVVESTKKIASQFKLDAESFYDPDDRKQGFIAARDRDGNEQQAPLITVSAVILELPESDLPITTAEDFGNVIADLKKKAKKSSDNLCVANILNVAPRSFMQVAGGY